MSNPAARSQANLRIALACACLAILCGCSRAAPPTKTTTPRRARKTDSRVEKLVGGKAAATLIRDLSQSTTCLAYRIGGFQVGQGPLAPEVPPAKTKTAQKSNPQTIHGYPVTSHAVPIDSESQATLSQILHAPETYLWDSAKACEFLPGIALQLAADDITLDILICFSCDELVFYANGELAGHEDFDPRRTDLLKVMKHLFPDDQKIQTLK